MLMLTGGAMVPCAIVDFFTNAESWGVFGLTGFLLLGIGGVMAIAAGRSEQQTGTREAFLLTTLVWFVLPLAAATPFLALGFTFTDAFFESVSGLTTTGATIMTGLDTEQKGLLLWRSILQWIGGVGIIVTAIAILPMLRVGGMQLFHAESSDVSDKMLPRVTEIAKQITWLYLALTIVCAICYMIAGMDLFDAINHSMTTMAAGGYSTSDQSMGKFADTRVIEVAIIFMFVAGLPFTTMVMMFHGNYSSLLRDPQPRFFLGVVIIAVVILYLCVRYHPQTYFIRHDEHLLRDTMFSVISVITGTGYASTDYGQWGSLPELVFFTLMFVGGCAGSAACGMNIFRVEIILRTMWTYTRQMLSPNRVLMVRYGGRPVRDDVLQSIMTFTFLYLLTFSVAAALLSLTGLDAISALSAAATSISNVGPGLGDIFGPSGTFQSIPTFAKWVCSISMVFGRLELLTLFVVLTPSFWRT
ncbi:MAG: cation transporter [Ponticaulis sp.]|nr:cation transporter [Ponticaulis sp.]